MLSPKSNTGDDVPKCLICIWFAITYLLYVGWLEIQLSTQLTSSIHASGRTFPPHLLWVFSKQIRVVLGQWTSSSLKRCTISWASYVPSEAVGIMWGCIPPSWEKKRMKRWSQGIANTWRFLPSTLLMRYIFTKSSSYNTKHAISNNPI